MDNPTDPIDSTAGGGRAPIPGEERLRPRPIPGDPVLPVKPAPEPEVLQADSVDGDTGELSGAARRRIEQGHEADAQEGDPGRPGPAGSPAGAEKYLPDRPIPGEPSEVRVESVPGRGEEAESSAEVEPEDLFEGLTPLQFRALDLSLEGLYYAEIGSEVNRSSKWVQGLMQRPEAQRYLRAVHAERHQLSMAIVSQGLGQAARVAVGELSADDARIRLRATDLLMRTGDRHQAIADMAAEIVELRSQVKKLGALLEAVKEDRQ